jgi:CheY-like chemotaxis protein
VQPLGSALRLTSAHDERITVSKEKKRILIVDDEPSITRLLKLNLERTGDYEVATENIAQAALPAAEEFLPNLILLDMKMPGMDGRNLAAALQASPKLQGVPIIFLTASSTPEDLSQADGLAGGLPFMTKPVNLQEVLACLERYLGTPQVAVSPSVVSQNQA